MASKLLSVLDNIEKGRQRIIDRANFHNFDLPSNASFDEIASVFELITPNYIPEKETVQDPWIFPDYLHDVSDIINNAENIVYNNSTYYPKLIMTYKDDAETSTFNKNIVYNTSGVLFKTSDDSIYLDPTGVIHEWSDVDNKYVIVYWRYTSSDFAVQVGSSSATGVTQVIIKDSITSLSSWTSVNAAPDLINFEAPSLISVYSSQSLFQNCPELEHINMESFERISNRINTLYFIYNCPKLYNVNMPNLKNIPSGYLYYNVPKLKGVDLSNIVNLTADSSGSTNLGSSWTYNGESYFSNRDIWYPSALYLPKLLNWSMNGAESIYAAPTRSCFQEVYYLKVGPTNFKAGIRMDDLINFDYEDGAIFNIMVLHNLRDYTFNKPCLVKSLTSEKLKHVDFTNVTFMLTNDYIQLGCASNCTSAIFPENISNNINIKYYNSLDRESLLDLFNKLSIVEGKTIVLCDEQKAKLSEEDIAIATEKGWTIQ